MQISHYNRLRVALEPAALKAMAGMPALNEIAIAEEPDNVRGIEV
jgi:hypothetical protein